MRVSIVIPAWNLWEQTSACLRSLAQHTEAEAPVEVIVADNGSTDATVAQLAPLGRALFGQRFRALRLPENLGFARACNAGAQAAAGELLFFLNNDTRCRPGWLAPLLAAFADARVGAAGPRLLYPDGTLQHCGITFTPFFRMGHLYEHFPGDHPLLRKKRPLQAITGAALMLPRPLFLEHGGFCEEYRNGYEDMDLCLKLARSGRTLAVAGESVFIHHTSATPGRFVHDTENGALFMRRWRGSVRPDLHLLGRPDGYTLRIGPDLSCWLEVPAERAARLEAGLARQDRHAVTRALEREPLWPGGWLRLMSLYEAEGNGRAALETAMRALRFIPSRDVAARLARLARPDGPLAEFAPEAEAISAELGPPADVAQRAANHALVLDAHRSANAAGDTALAALLADWLVHNPLTGTA